MTVKEVILEVTKIADESLYLSIKNGQEQVDDEVKQKLDLLLSCYNYVLKSIALNYYDYLTQIKVLDSKLTVTTLNEPMIKLLSVTDEFGKPLLYRLSDNELEVEKSPFILKYRAIPCQQGLNDVYKYENTVVGTNVLIYGTLAEYLLMQNRIEEALNWENKYRQAIEVRKDYKSRKMKVSKRWGL
ncbi:MAG: hypothetical protein IKA99_02670 [Clostridia bacterium]|nr:hypothetical protein [Clostridia bacterium]